MPVPSYASLEEAVRGCFGESVTIKERSGFASGDISSTYALKLSDGRSVLLKTNTIANRDFFDAEAEGLCAIADTKTIGTPELYAKGEDRAKGFSFLMMELIETGPADSEAWRCMGYDMAALHLADASGFTRGRFGFSRDNYIGATVQLNTPMDSWIEFFRTCRLEPQLKMAEKSLTPSDIRDSISLLDRLGSIITEPDKPSLIHGDMWGGNHLIGRNKKAYVIDPAAYVGHAEADIAMTEMFTPMRSEFYRGYYEKIPKKDGYEDRREIYNLYHVLNHYNLFGGFYLSSALATIKRYKGRQ